MPSYCQRNKKNPNLIDKSQDETEPSVEAIIDAESTSQTDFYQILGVSEDVTLKEIKKKWLKLCLLYHPDQCGGDDEKFRKINLAYKVLSNPENRNKYDNSLAKTYDQLVDKNNRDQKYHINEEFLTTSDQSSKKQFNRNKFLQEFDKRRHQFKDLNEIEVVNENQAQELPKKTIEQIMAERNAELDQFKTTQKTELFDPKKNNEEFNFVFNQFRKMTRTDLEESNTENIFLPESQLDSAPVGDLLSQNHFNQQRELIKQMTHQYQEQFLNSEDKPIVTSQESIDQQLANKKFEEMKKNYNPEYFEIKDDIKISFPNHDNQINQNFEEIHSCQTSE